MSDPTSADKVLVALAERASKRRSQFKKEERKEDRLEESVQQAREQVSNQKEQTRINSKPKKVNVSIKEEFPPMEIDDYDESDYSEPEELSKILRKPNNFSNYESNVPVRKVQRTSRTFFKSRKNLNPENADTFEEQVNLVGNLLCDKLSAFQAIPALKVTQEWIDCIVDENDSFYEEIYNKLILLNKEQLLGYIRILVSALK